MVWLFWESKRTEKRIMELEFIHFYTYLRVYFLFQWMSHLKVLNVLSFCPFCCVLFLFLIFIFLCYRLAYPMTEFTMKSWERTYRRPNLKKKMYMEIHEMNRFHQILPRNLGENRISSIYPFIWFSVDRISLKGIETFLGFI